MFPVPAYPTPKQQESPMGKKKEKRKDPNVDRQYSLKWGGGAWGERRDYKSREVGGMTERGRWLPYLDLRSQEGRTAVGSPPPPHRPTEHTS